MSREHAEEYDEDLDGEESGASRSSGKDRLGRSLSLGFLAMAPMFVVYELALLSTGGAQRNTSELVLFRVFGLFGDHADLARWLTLGLATIAALVRCLRQHWELGPRILRIVAEGVVGAIVLGPLLIGLIHLLGDSLPALPIGADNRPGAMIPGLARASFVFGAGAHEEMVFRVGAYCALYTVALRVGVFFLGARPAFCRPVAELAGLIGSAVLFSAFHLAVFVRWLGAGGEAFDPALFYYRALAGVLLGLLFRWRGPGVAAWTHGLFNVALLLGAGPNVFL
ncbi:MAG: hypothetical protein ACI8QZ_004144 [Chlamydiales bacterium]